MKFKRQHLMIYGSIYTFIIGIAIMALVLNIQTVSLNQKNQLLKKKIAQLEDENRTLQLEIETKLDLRNIESIAKTQLFMSPPTTISYIHP